MAFSRRAADEEINKSRRSRNAWVELGRQIRRGGKEGQLVDRSEFGRAFAEARISKEDEFVFNGERYHTRAPTDEERAGKRQSNGDHQEEVFKEEEGFLGSGGREDPW